MGYFSFEVRLLKIKWDAPVFSFLKKEYIFSVQLYASMHQVTAMIYMINMLDAPSLFLSLSFILES